MKERIAEIQLRMTQLADLCEKEKRQMTELEKVEFEKLKLERSQLSMKADIEDGRVFVEQQNRSDEFDNLVRSSLDERKQVSTVLKRSVQNLDSAVNLVPLTIGDIIPPLEKGLILDKVGIKMQTGLAGDYVYPIVAGVDAEIVGENVDLSDKTIDINKLKPVPKRVGISIPVSNFAIHQTNGVLLNIVQTQIPMALQRILNKWMFQPTAVADGCAGCFTAPSTTGIFAAATPTFAELINMKGKVYKNGIINDGTAAYVMTESMAALLEATPLDAGSGIMILQNGRINGIPVFTTEYITEGKVGFGVFSYQLLGQFGDINFTVDPFTGAKSSTTYFVLNSEFAMTSARPEAFALYSVPA